MITEALLKTSISIAEKGVKLLKTTPLITDFGPAGLACLDSTTLTQDTEGLENHRSDAPPRQWVGGGWQRETYREEYRGRRCSLVQAQNDQSDVFSSGCILGLDWLKTFMFIPTQKM